MLTKVKQIRDTMRGERKSEEKNAQASSGDKTFVYTQAYRAGLHALLVDVLRVPDLAEITVDFAWVNCPITLSVKDWFARGEHHDPGRLWFPLPASAGAESTCLPARPRRVEANVRWVDQGWGNRKGCLQLRIFRADNQPGGQERACVYNKSLFGIAEHNLKSANVVLEGDDLQGIEAQDECELWVVVGGGGGHSLKIDKFDISITF